MYVIIAIGITISFAGNPNINESSITPSSPNNFANGSRNNDNCFNIDIPFIDILDKHHIINPIGAEIITALPST